MSHLNEIQIAQFMGQLTKYQNDIRSVIYSIFQASDQISRQLAIKNLTNLTTDELIEFTSQIDDPALKKNIEQLKKTDASLISIELGMYGLCSDCESELTVEDLTIEPTLQRCPDCKDKYQKQKCNKYRL